MRPMSLGPLAIAVQLACATVGSAQTQPVGAEHSVAMSELIGRSTKEVRVRLFDGSADWPLQPAFQMATDEGQLSFIAIGDLMLDAESARREAMFRAHANSVPWEPHTLCQTRLVSQVGVVTEGARTVLMFRNDRLEAAFGPESETREPPPASDPEAPEAFNLQHHHSIFLAQGGDLPLADGLGFLKRWRSSRLSPADRLAVTCTTAAPPVAPTQRRAQSSLAESAMENLVLRPFAAAVFLPHTLTLPSKNKQRETARYDGQALLQSLHVGTRLGTTAEQFAATHKGVRVYRSKTGDNVVATIDLGAFASQNGTNFDDSALVGISGDRIDWISPPSGFGPRAELLCLDEHDVPGTERPGCSG